jgi:hypothetical protein
VDHPRGERPRLDELEVDLLAARREVRRAGAEHDRADEQPELVDEAELDRLGGEAGAADRDLALAGLLSQPADLVGEAAPDEPR